MSSNPDPAAGPRSPVWKAPKIDRELIRKYDVPGPRYTSYPTAPHFAESFGATEYEDLIRATNGATAPPPLSLYFHLPFCESVCYFCGCNVTFTKDRSRSEEYVDLLRDEMDRTLPLLKPGRKVVQLHWGGGTPTFIPAPVLERLWGFIHERFEFADGAEIGVEIDPRATTEEHLRLLSRCGFNRLSMGIQDFDPKVQEAVHRIQPEEINRRTVEQARALGFTSINVDLIYGLPYQTPDSFARTVDKLISLSPDRVACFNFAYLPELIKHQRAIPKAAMPPPAMKLDILEAAVERLTAAGYGFVGMDHFAKPEDELFRAIENRTLYRNFQGYSTHSGCDLYGFGVSSISQVGDCYVQNRKVVEEYRREVRAGRLPAWRGVRLSADDLLRRDLITRLMCHFVVVKSEIEKDHGIRFDETFQAELEDLRPLEQDGLVRLAPDRIEIPLQGRLLIRNVAMVFDAYLRGKGAQHRFSRTV